MVAETALHIAVKNKHHNIVSLLLAAGANPNLRMYLPDDESMRQANDDYVFTGLYLYVNYYWNVFFFISKSINLNVYCDIKYFVFHNKIHQFVHGCTRMELLKEVIVPRKFFETFI